MWYSRIGLVTALKGEGFSDSAATYGAANCGASWNDEAVRAANYFGDGSVVRSPNEIRNLLINADFTSAEADYGVANCSVDWATMAKKVAKNAVDYDTWSYMALGNNMYGDGFDSADINDALAQFT